MKKSKGFAIVAGVFGLSSASLCLGHQYGVAAGVAGVAFLYAAIAYRMKKTGT